MIGAVIAEEERRREAFDKGPRRARRPETPEPTPSVPDATTQPDPDPAAAARFRAAADRLHDGNLLRALRKIQDAEQALAERPDRRDAAVLRAEIERNRKQYAKDLADLHRTNPDAPVSDGMIAKVEDRLGKRNTGGLSRKYRQLAARLTRRSTKTAPAPRRYQPKLKASPGRAPSIKVVNR